MSEVCTKIASGHTVHEVDCATKEKIDKLLPGPWADVVLLRPHNWVLLRSFLQIHEKVYNFKFRPDDVVVMTYPKCGTTWSQEIVWNMRNNPDLDNPDADDALFVRSPYLEMDMLFVPGLQIDVAVMSVFMKGIEKYVKDLDQHWRNWTMFQVAEAHRKPRTIKTHLPFSMLPKKLFPLTPQVVYVSRNPKDKVLSAQHHYKLTKMHNFVGTQDEFVDLFVEDLLLYSPYGQHLKEAWSRRHHPNFFMTTFEELKADTRQQLTKLDAFLGTGLTDKRLDNLSLARSLTHSLTITHSNAFDVCY
ncbi:sulfotransferase 1C4-like [Hyalella azteca]|uniref:Sulfotransferase 1C4-like n=1 Tax=Hyalella azteca TaxID=294128 RepID=A0A979FN83_HYAAZ|nr:sulfotransferase 1C4-like [Hyalella azteca]